MDGSGGWQERDDGADAVLPVLAFGAAGNAIALALGAHLRVYDSKTSAAANLKDETALGVHTDAIRSVAFSACGRWMATGGDDKLFKLWECASWTCKWTIRQPKKVCAVAFCPDSKHVLFANKFGDVNISPVDESGARAAPTGEPELLFGHWCSIVTSLSVTPDGRYVLSADRDNKVRVSILPPPGHRMGGAHEVQAFCLGHTAFVTSAAAVLSDTGASEGVLSCGGDGTLRLWNPHSGEQIALLDAPAPAQQGGEAAAAGGAGAEAGGEGRDGQEPPVVSEVAVARGGVAAATVEGSPDVLLLKADISARSLTAVGSAAMPGRGVAPMTIAFSPQGELWAVSGAILGGQPKFLLSASRVAGGAAEPVALSQGVLDTLLGAGHDDASAAEAVKAAAGAARVSSALRKRKYDSQDVEGRKQQSRKDKKGGAKGGGQQQGGQKQKGPVQEQHTKAFPGRVEAAAGGGAPPVPGAPPPPPVGLQQ